MAQEKYYLENLLSVVTDIRENRFTVSGKKSVFIKKDPPPLLFNSREEILQAFLVYFQMVITKVKVDEFGNLEYPKDF